MHFRHLIHPAPDWLDSASPRRVAQVALIAGLGFALYGFTIGFWRAPLMGAYVAIKFPLLIVLTLASNGLLNGLLGLLLGSGLGFRQSLLALLSSFALAALILASLAPVTFFLAWNAPAPSEPGAAHAHAAYLLTHTLLIGFAGIAANLHLHRQLLAKAPTRIAATSTLLAWLTGNAFLGAQFSWILRPFFGTPRLEVQFLRPNPFEGNFYETVWNALDRITNGSAIFALIFILFLIFTPIYHALSRNQATTPQP